MPRPRWSQQTEVHKATPPSEHGLGQTKIADEEQRFIAELVMRKRVHPWNLRNAQRHLLRFNVSSMPAPQVLCLPWAWLRLLPRQDLLSPSTHPVTKRLLSVRECSFDGLIIHESTQASLVMKLSRNPA